MGAPNVTEHKIDTSTTSPLGMTRCTLLIQVGTSTTCGSISASLYRPDLNGCGSPPWLRVHSGKITIECCLQGPAPAAPAGRTRAGRRAILRGSGPVASGDGSGPPAMAVWTSDAAAALATGAAVAAGRAGVACRSIHTTLNTAVVIHCRNDVLVQ